MTVKERIEQHQGYVLVTSYGADKVHVDPNCRYLRYRDDDPRRKPLSVFPEGYLELCDWCERYLDRWDDGFQPRDKCERCGKGATPGEYCDDCFQVVQRYD